MRGNSGWEVHPVYVVGHIPLARGNCHLFLNMTFEVWFPYDYYNHCDS